MIVNQANGTGELLLLLILLMILTFPMNGHYGDLECCESQLVTTNLDSITRIAMYTIHYNKF